MYIYINTLVVGFIFILVGVVGPKVTTKSQLLTGDDTSLVKK